MKRLVGTIAMLVGSLVLVAATGGSESAGAQKGSEQESGSRPIEGRGSPKPTPSAGPSDGLSPAPEDSLLSCAVTVAERLSIPAMLAESNLTWKSSQLAALARLLSKAGRFRRALELTETVGGPERVIAPAFGEIAIVALETGDSARFKTMVAKLSAMRVWTSPVALAKVAGALQDAGRREDAYAMVAAIEDAAVRAGALLELVRRASGTLSDEIGRWLNEALTAAALIPPGLEHRDIGDGRREMLEEHSRRLAALLDVVAAAVELGKIDSARKGGRGDRESSGPQSVGVEGSGIARNRRRRRRKGHQRRRSPTTIWGGPAYQSRTTTSTVVPLT